MFQVWVISDEQNQSSVLRTQQFGKLKQLVCGMEEELDTHYAMFPVPDEMKISNYYIKEIKEIKIISHRYF